MNRYPEVEGLQTYTPNVVRMLTPLALAVSLGACGLNIEHVADEADTPQATTTTQKATPTETGQQIQTQSQCDSLKTEGFITESTGQRQTLYAIGNKYSLPIKSIDAFSKGAGLTSEAIKNDCVVVPAATIDNVSDEKFAKMRGFSWRPSPDCPPQDELSIVNAPYRGYDKKSHVGTLVVNKVIADKTAVIFQTVYTNTDFQIESILPLEDIAEPQDKTDDLGTGAKAIDYKSMEQNNTSGLNCRNAVLPQGQKPHISAHGTGLAIDVNTRTNPYVLGDEVQPANGTPERSPHRPGLISYKDEDGAKVINIFKGQGFTWGGDNKDPDYQHFAYDMTRS